MSYEKLQLLINGEWRDQGTDQYETVLNPATDEPLSSLPHANQQDLDLALSSSEEGFGVWRNTPAIERQAIMEKAARLLEERHERISSNLTLEMG